MDQKQRKIAPRNIFLINTNECKDLLDDFTLLDTSFIFVQILHKKEKIMKHESKTKGGLF